MNEEKKKALQKAMRLCSRSEKCAKDIRDKLFQWKIASDWHDEIIAQLYEQKFLDDRRYAESYLHDKIYLSKWGKQKVRYALQLKGLSASLVNEILEEVDTERYELGLLNLLQTKIKSIKASTDYEKKAKLMRFGQSRGFSITEIDNIIHKIQ